MPRHPPCALDNLTNTPTPATQSSSKPGRTHQGACTTHLQVKKKDARVHSALDNHTRRPPPQHQNLMPGSDCPENTTTPQHTGERSSSQDPTVHRRHRTTPTTGMAGPCSGLRFHIKPSKQPPTPHSGRTALPPGTRPAGHHEVTRHRPDPDDPRQSSLERR
jgi:hypothetical protein